MKIRWRSAFSTPTVALVVALAIGCSKSSSPSPGGTTGGAPGADAGTPDAGSGPLGSGNLTSATSVANGSTFTTPFDAAPSPDGATLYFTGVDPAAGSAIFKVGSTAGSTPSVLTSGCASATCDFTIGAPLGIAVSSDGSTVYVADPAYIGGGADTGYVFSVPSAGGGQTPLPETAGYNARAITVSKVGGSDNLFFVGDDKGDGTPAIFKDASGTVSTVLKGGDPQAVAVASDGTAYFVDGNGSVQKVAAGGAAATPLGASASNLAVSYPVGIALSQDEKFLLVAVTDPTGKQAIARIDVTSGASTLLSVGLPATNTEGGGLHRAANADVYSFVDTTAGSTGSVYLLK